MAYPPTPTFAPSWYGTTLGIEGTPQEQRLLGLHLRLSR